MRMLMVAAALGGFAVAGAPAAAQAYQDEEAAIRGAGQAVREAAPMVGRSADALLELDIGPLLDAADPYGRRGRHRTLREIARRDDPDFERRLQGAIHRGAARLSGMMDAIAAATPAMRRSLREMEAAIGAAIEAAPHHGPPGGTDDDWGFDPDDRPY